MSNVILTVATSTVVVLGISAQSRPDFSGSWQLDMARSDIAAYSDTPGPVSASIIQSATEIQIATTTSRGTTSVSYAFAAADGSRVPGTPVARWQGDALLTEAVREIRGQSVTVQQTRRLASDGHEMIVDSVVNVQHGYSVLGAKTYGSGRDVFVRVPR
jgi:hypothetical protein